MVNCRMMTKNLTPLSIVEDQYNDDKKYFVSRGTYDVKYGTWRDLELIELPYYTVLVREDGDYIVTENGLKIKV